MKIIKNIGHLLLRIWFYTLMALPILVFFPLLLILTSRETWYPLFFKFARRWAQFVLYFSGFIPVRKNGVFHAPKQSFMFVANHTSMLDILLMLYTVKNSFVFVGKKELTKIPIFGFFYKKTCILVDRSNAHSRQAVFMEANRKIKSGLSICIFPEGGVPDDTSILLDIFKDGAFRLAIEHQLPIVPLVFTDNKKRLSYSFFSGGIGTIKSFILDTIPTQGLQLVDKAVLKNEVRNKILEKLRQKNKAEKFRLYSDN